VKKINIVISDDLEHRFRQAVGHYRGVKKGNLSRAMEEAMDLWISAQERSEVPRSRKTEIGFG
jgi:hypothetical protein